MQARRAKEWDVRKHVPPNRTAIYSSRLEHEKSLVLPDASLLHLNPVKRVAALICLGFLAGNAPLNAAAAADADSILRKVGSFAMGGVGVAGAMSEGERALREVLKESDAVPRLERLLPEASAPGQLFALLGLRARDRDVYQRALAKYGQRDTKVQTCGDASCNRSPFAAW